MCLRLSENHGSKVTNLKNAIFIFFVYIYPAFVSWRYYLSLFQVSIDGYLVLGESYARSYPPADGSWPPEIPIIAPYWTNMETGNFEELGVLVIETVTEIADLAKVKGAINDAEFDPAYAMIANWLFVAPYPYNVFHNSEVRTGNVQPDV